MNKLVISIVTWNSAATIHSCVQSVLDQTYTDFTLIIVDNDSKDETSSIVKSFKNPRIKFIQKNENTGFCGGHNFSIRSTSSEFVLLVNPDIKLSPDYVEKCISVIEDDDSVGTVCGLLLQNNPEDRESLIDSAGLDITKSRVMKMRFHEMKRTEVDLEKQYVFGADGALPMYRREMIDDISIENQFFDEMFFAHKEDWDISWRSNLYGWKTVFTPECVAVHPRHFKPNSLKVRSSIDKKIKVHSVKNQLILLLKNESVLSFFRNIVYILPRQIFILGYILLFERTSLMAYVFILNNFKDIMAKRRVIQFRKNQNDELKRSH